MIGFWSWKILNIFLDKTGVAKIWKIKAAGSLFEAPKTEINLGLGGQKDVF